MSDQDRAFIKESVEILSSKDVSKIKKCVESCFEKKERKVQAKNSMFITACDNLVEKIEQKLLPIHLDYNDFVELSCVISSKIEETENVFHILTKYENASQTLCLFSKFLKGKLLKRYVKTFSMKKSNAYFFFKKNSNIQIYVLL